MRRYCEAHDARPARQDIARTGLGWLHFMGLNGNVRYNLLHAAEDVLHARCNCLLLRLHAMLHGSMLPCPRSPASSSAGDMRGLWLLRQVSCAMDLGAHGGAADVEHGHWRTRMGVMCGSSRSGEDGSGPAVLVPWPKLAIRLQLARQPLV